MANTTLQKLFTDKMLAFIRNPADVMSTEKADAGDRAICTVWVFILNKPNHLRDITKG